MVLVALVAVNACLFFVYYLPRTFSASTNYPGLEKKALNAPDLEEKRHLFSPNSAFPAPTGEPVLVGAGDIASCASTGDEATAKLLADMPNATVFTLGDDVYEDGTPTELNDCYDPSWGRFKAHHAQRW